MTYKIVRFFKDNKKPKVVIRGLTLDEARSHCSETTSHKKKNGEILWFEGYSEE